MTDGATTGGLCWPELRTSATVTPLGRHYRCAWCLDRLQDRSRPWCSDCNITESDAAQIARILGTYARERRMRGGGRWHV